jgi:hypothetical protein
MLTLRGPEYYMDCAVSSSGLKNLIVSYFVGRWAVLLYYHGLEKWTGVPEPVLQECTGSRTPRMRGCSFSHNVPSPDPAQEPRASGTSNDRGRLP